MVFGVKPEELLDALISYYPSAVQGRAGGHVLPFVINRWSQGEATVTQPQAQLPGRPGHWTGSVSPFRRS